jgi:hypothetical protein
MIGQASNQMLAKMEQEIQAKIPQNLKAGFERVIHAGMSILYSQNLNQQLKQRIAQTKDPITEAADGAARMVTVLYSQSKKTMPTELLMPAAMVFAIEYVDLLAKAGKAQITPQFIGELAQAVTESVMKAMGISKEKLKQVMAERTAQINQGAQPQQAGIIGGAKAQGV